MRKWLPIVVVLSFQSVPLSVLMYYSVDMRFRITILSSVLIPIASLLLLKHKPSRSNAFNRYNMRVFITIQITTILVLTRVDL